MIDKVWIIPALMAASFLLILFFGKRWGTRATAGIGIGAVSICLILSVIVAGNWISRVNHPPTGAALAADIVQANGLTPQSTETIGEEVNSATKDSGETVSADSHSTTAAEGHSSESGGEHGGEHSSVPPVVRTVTWFQIGGMDFEIGTLVDGLAAMMLITVCIISLLVHIYSTEYLHGDVRFTHYYAFLSLFTASMLFYVLSSNTLQMLVGWELVGVCSFGLIGHWWEEKKNTDAALKAFLTNRVGDIGLILGVIITFFAAGGNSFNVLHINEYALSGNANTTLLLVGALCLFGGVTSKSGQFPLHTWLPDAMAGPTPVSALIHAATMVVAGVYLIARLYAVFFSGLAIGSSTFHYVAFIGGFTTIIGGLLAFVQHDLKKVLAYSTISQLGYMVMALGVGAWTAGVFHLFTHAFFKACLFLGAGSISHSASHHSFEMKKDMGGLRKFMPVTFGTWIISTLALCGVFPFSGFFSKDEIIDNVGNNGYTLFMWVGLAGAFLTAAYMTRATYLTFFGEARGAAAGEHHDAGHGDAGHGTHDAHDTAHGHDDHAHGAHGGDDAHGHDAHHGPHESPALITVPLVLLAALAIGSGLLNAVPFGEKFEKFTHWVEPRVEVISPTGLATVAGGPGESLVSAEEGEGHKDSPCGKETPKDGICVAPKLEHAKFKWSKAALSMFIVLMGMVTSWVLCVQLYGRKKGPVVGLTERNALLRRGHRLLVNKYYLDHLYEKVVVHSIAHPIAAAAYWVNQKILDGAVNGAGTTARSLSGWVYRNVDQRVVDGAVNGSGSAARGLGGVLRPVQSGKVNHYGALLFGTAAIAALVFVIINT